MDQTNNSAQGTGLLGKLRDGAVSQLNTQKNRTTDGIASVVGAVRHSTQQLRNDHHEQIADYVERAAAQIDRFTSTLKNKDTAELLGDAQRFARRNPAVFIGTAFAVGLTAARFFKSSHANGNGGDWRRQATAPGGYGYGYSSGRGAADFATTPVGTAGSARRSVGTPSTSIGEPDYGGRQSATPGTADRLRSSDGGTERF